MRPTFLLLAAIGLLLPMFTQVRASTAIYVGKHLTRDGSVLLAGFGDESSSHWLTLVPHQQHPLGSTIKVGGRADANSTREFIKGQLPGELIDIPQASETFRYLSMDYSFFSGLPAPLTNGGMNEFGVAVRDVALFSRQELIDLTPRPQHGLNYSDVARVVLERAHTAREAVEIAIALIEKYGDFTYGGNSHVFADPNEGWVLLEFAGGKNLWVAHRLGPDDVWLNWRGYTPKGYIQSLPLDWQGRDDYRASADFVSFAVKKGWAKGPGPFNIIDAYAKRNQYGPVTAAEAPRIEAVIRAAAPNVDPQLLMHLLHGIGKDSSGYGQVAHLRADIHPLLRTLWIAPGPPITGAFVPWRLGVESIPPEYRMHRYLTAGEAERFLVDPAQRGLESTRYVNGAVKRLLYLVQEHREQFLPEVSQALEAFEARAVTAQPDIERTANLLLAADPVLLQRYLTREIHSFAKEGMDLVEAMGIGIEARTRAIYGVRPLEAQPPALTDTDRF